MALLQEKLLVSWLISLLHVFFAIILGKSVRHDSKFERYNVNGSKFGVVIKVK